MNQHPGLARTGTGQNQQIRFRGRDRVGLGFVEFSKQGMCHGASLPKSGIGFRRNVDKRRR